MKRDELYPNEYLLDIPNYSMYKVSNLGRVYSIYANKFIQREKENGYVCAFMKDTQGVRKWKYAHRLVCLVFNGKPKENGLCVNHINGVKNDNNPSNLEWTTMSANIKHSYDVLKRKPNGFKSGHVVSDKTKLLQSKAKLGINHPKFKGYYVVNGVRYASPNEAAKHMPISAITIYRRCKANDSINYSFDEILK